MITMWLTAVAPEGGVCELVLPVWRVQNRSTYTLTESVVFFSLACAHCNSLLTSWTMGEYDEVVFLSLLSSLFRAAAPADWAGLLGILCSGCTSAKAKIETSMLFMHDISIRSSRLVFFGIGLGCSSLSRCPGPARLNFMSVSFSLKNFFILSSTRTGASHVEGVVSERRG